MEAIMARVGTFGERLRAIRAARGLTLAELAEMSGMHLQTIARIESGTRPNPTWDTVLALSKVLGISPNDFLEAGPDQPDDDPDPPSRPTGKRK